MKEVSYGEDHAVQKTATGLFAGARFTGTVAVSFWIFNVLYAVTVTLVGGPLLISSLWDAVLAGNAPWHHLGVVVLAMLVSIVCTGLVLRYRLYQDSVRLGQFLVGVELPIATVLVTRSLWAHEWSVGSLSLYALMLGVALCQGWLLIRHKIADLPVYKPNSVPVSAASAVVAVGGVYLSLLMLVFSAPLTVGLVVGGVYLIGGGFMSLLEFSFSVLAIGFGFLALMVGALFLWLAAYAPYCFVAQWKTRMRLLDSALHKRVSMLLFAAVITLFAFMHINAQPYRAPELDGAAISDERQQALLQDAEKIRLGLTDTYLANIRYLPANFGFRSSHPLMEMRHDLLKAMLPSLFYQGNVRVDQRKADTDYQAFFDTPIQRAERSAIVGAIKSHWTPNLQPFAGLLDIGQRTVHVESQAVSVQVTQGVAQITVQEVLRNRTPRQLETLQYFTLPQDAVITGLWLSDTTTQPRMYAFQVAPRGAAQQVYREQVQRRIDPALLEQVGPRHYRLRVFPVLPTEPMVVTLSYKTLPNTSGQWPLPELLEQRNIFWDTRTKRTVNGKLFKSPDEEGWLPAQMSATGNAGSAMLAYTDADNHYYATDLDKVDVRPASAGIAVLIDGSYSMGNHTDALADALDDLPDADWFFCKHECIETDETAQSQWVFYGNTQPLQQLGAFGPKNDLHAYESVLMISDGGSYEIDVAEQVAAPDLPVWLVELGAGSFAYHDNLLDTLRSSGGGIVGNVRQALAQQQLQKNSTDQVVSVGSERVWFKRNARSGDRHNPALGEIVAGARIRAASQANREPSLASLDALHDIALQHGIVSNYSSMIVLVNKQQRDRLKELTGADDRFERELETGEQNLLNAPAVPEPHEWALLLLSLGLLLLTAYRKGYRAIDFYALLRSGFGAGRNPAV